jgi:hypothetical protein
MVAWCLLDVLAADVPFDASPFESYWSDDVVGTEAAFSSDAGCADAARADSGA